MKSSVRGMECFLHSETSEISKLLTFLSQETYEFYIPWCSMINKTGMLLPEGFRDFFVSAEELNSLAEQTIWELVLHMYPPGTKPEPMETYEDFLNSACACCLIFYDCSMLEVYVKERRLFQKVWDKLTFMHAGDLKIITDTSFGRTAMHI